MFKRLMMYLNIKRIEGICMTNGFLLGFSYLYEEDEKVLSLCLGLLAIDIYFW
jgi:hypothetical protein